MKYILMDQRDGDIFNDEFATKEEALKAGWDAWSYLTLHDRQHRNEFCVIETKYPDEEDERHFEGKVIFDWLLSPAVEILEKGAFEAAIELMDDEIREAVHADLSPCTEEEFLDEYMKRHEKKYNETFEIN